MKSIPIFKLTFDAEFRQRFHAGCEQIFDEGFLTNHHMVANVEHQFRGLNSSEYALAVSSGTSALEVALRAIDVRGREVILPNNTFIATFLAIKNAGGIPVIVDIEDKYYSLCPIELQKRINPKVKAVITVHIGGHISPAVKEIKKICQTHDVLLVEDAAHAHFAEFEGIKAGNIGDVGCFSFHMTKVVTGGEGGMIITKSRELYDQCFSLRQFGMDLTNHLSHKFVGSNFKLSEFNALAISLDLERSSERIHKRKQLAIRYQSRLSGTGWFARGDSKDSFGSYYKQIILPPKNISRETISQVFKKAQMTLTNGVYYLPLNHQPVCREDVAVNANFPVSENFCQRHICPPCYPELEIEEVDRICDSLLSIKEVS